MTGVIRQQTFAGATGNIEMDRAGDRLPTTAGGGYGFVNIRQLTDTNSEILYPIGFADGPITDDNGDQNLDNIHVQLDIRDVIWSDGSTDQTEPPSDGDWDIAQLIIGFEWKLGYTLICVGGGLCLVFMILCIFRWQSRKHRDLVQESAEVAEKRLKQALIEKEQQMQLKMLDMDYPETWEMQADEQGRPSELPLEGLISVDERSDEY
eukprot:SAG31_NODE_13057_length_896_cov_0.830615_1_plen_207_part_10